MSPPAAMIGDVVVRDPSSEGTVCAAAGAAVAATRTTTTIALPITQGRSSAALMVGRVYPEVFACR